MFWFVLASMKPVHGPLGAILFPCFLRISQYSLQRAQLVKHLQMHLSALKPYTKFSWFCAQLNDTELETLHKNYDSTSTELSNQVRVLKICVALMFSTERETLRKISAQR